MSQDSRSAAARAAQVLIVDDDEDQARSLAMLLELEDIVAISAPDGASALALLEHTSPPLLLIDIGLPGMSGFELAQLLRQLPGTRNATLIALTGRDDHATKDPARKLFDQYWTKPFDPKKLLKAVQALLAGAATVSG